MYNLYPPIFIRDDEEKSSYINTLGNSFTELEAKPKKWNNEISSFFDQEIGRLRFNSLLVLDSVQKLGSVRMKDNSSK
jgi:hypothetical protein